MLTKFDHRGLTRLPRRQQEAGTERGTGKVWAGMGAILDAERIPFLPYLSHILQTSCTQVPVFMKLFAMPDGAAIH